MKQLFALRLAEEFYRESRQLKLPTHLKNQYFRACSSVALNLAEGTAKPTVADRKKFYFVALGSLRECQSILRISGSEVILKKSDFLGVCIYKLCQSVR